MGVMRGREKFYRYKRMLLLGARIYSMFPKKYCVWRLKSIQDKKGILYMAQRWMLLKNIAIHVGDNVSIHEHVYLFNADRISFGNNVSIHPMCYIQGSGGVVIGNDVSIAHGVTIMTENHRYSDTTKAIKDQDIEYGQIEISDNVWIGAKATILYGNHISEGCVVAAGAVVTKEIPMNSIVAGVPARVIRLRDLTYNETSAM